MKKEIELAAKAEYPEKLNTSHYLYNPIQRDCQAAFIKGAQWMATKILDDDDDRDIKLENEIGMVKNSILVAFYFLERGEVNSAKEVLRDAIPF